MVALINDLLTYLLTYLKFQRRTGFRPRRAQVFLGDCNNDRQLEMNAETGNTYITETMRDAVEILTVNWNQIFSIMATLVKVDREQPITRNGNITFWTPMSPFIANENAENCRCRQPNPTVV